jgi:hypothetical protein
MTQRIKVAGPGFDFATLSAAIASIPPGALIEPIVIEVHSTAPPEGIVVPAAIIPSAANPLIIMSLRSPTAGSLFGPITYDSGSMHDVAPPQPRHLPAIMLSFDVQAVHTKIDGFKVFGNIFVKGNFGVIINGNIIENGQIQVVRAVSVSVTARISNNEIRRGSARSGVIVSKANSVKLWHNTVLQRRSDSADIVLPTIGFEIVNSVIDSRNNVAAAAGAGSFAISFSGSSAGTFFANNLYASFDGAKRFQVGPVGGPFTETDDLNQWKGIIGGEIGSISGDPEFRDRLSLLDVNLDVSNTSPTMAGAPALPDVTTDIRGERRPSDFVTMGAHEHAEVITDDGKIRFLELLSGLSVQPVTKCVLGLTAGPTLFEEFPAQLSGDNTVDNPLFTPIDIEGIVVPAIPGSEGLVVFRPSFQVTIPIYGELIDTVFDRANEIGLVTADNKAFLIKRMHSIPFDACGFMHTQMTIPVEIVS